MTSFRRLAFFLIAFLFLFSGSLPGVSTAAALEPAHGGKEDTSLILNDAINRIRFSVDRESSNDNRKWIVLRAEYSATILTDSSEVASVLKDYSNMPSTFKNISEIKVLYDNDTEARTVQTTTVRALGLAFTNTLEFLIRYEFLSMGAIKQTFAMVDGDGSVLKSYGSWMIEPIIQSSARATLQGCRITYSIESWLEPRYPLQETVLRNFGPEDLKDLFHQLAAAILRRRNSK